MKLKAPTNVETKADIIWELTNVYQTVDQFISKMEEETFYKSRNGKWSSMQHLQHLILSSKRIPSALNMSKFKLMLLGKAKGESRRYDELKSKYYEVLSGGATAGKEYSPEPDTQWSKEELLGNWRMIQDKFEKRIAKWSEKDLDTYQLPHPALGKLTFREMLFFTIFHTYHHLQGMGFK